jgi:hypothetical protein
MLLKDVDSLPHGPNWSLIHESIHGESSAEEGELDLWVRDPVECIRDLIGNPEFKNDIKYAPERVWVWVVEGHVVDCIMRCGQVTGGGGSRWVTCSRNICLLTSPVPSEGETSVSK